MCYNCRRPRHIAKDCHEVGPACLYCQLVGHQVEDCPRLIAKLEEQDIKKGVVKENLEHKKVLGNHREKRMEDFQALLDERKAHTNVSLSKSLKEKQCISARIIDFDIDGVVLDEETNLNIMTEEAWEAMERPTLLPSLGRVGLFKGS